MGIYVIITGTLLIFKENNLLMSHRYLFCFRDKIWWVYVGFKCC